jgi:hypothetical protein
VPPRSRRQPKGSRRRDSARPRRGGGRTRGRRREANKSLRGAPSQPMKRNSDVVDKAVPLIDPKPPPNPKKPQAVSNRPSARGEKRRASARADPSSLGTALVSVLGGRGPAARCIERARGLIKRRPVRASGVPLRRPRAPEPRARNRRKKERQALVPSLKSLNDRTPRPPSRQQPERARPRTGRSEG